MEKDTYRNRGTFYIRRDSEIMNNGRRISGLTAFAAAIVLSSAPLQTAQNGMVPCSQIIAAASYDNAGKYPAVNTQVNDNRIGFRWTAVQGAEKYGIGVYQAEKWVVKKQVDGSVTSWTSPQVSDGTYRLAVLAKVDGEWVNADVFRHSFYVTVNDDNVTVNDDNDLTDLSFVKINEVCASNKGCLVAADGTKPDWIELYNTSTEAIDISGVGLSEGKKNRYKFTFPENTVIDGGSYILVLCDKEHIAAETDTGFYTNGFNIGKSGETIYMTAPKNGDENGADLDTVTVCTLNNDETYARRPDGSDSFAILAPTPGYSNNDVKVKVKTEAPVFSAAAGFYDDAFELSLTAPEGCTVRYTTDGSDPVRSETAKEYDAAETIRIYDNTNDANVCSAVKDISLIGYDPPADGDVEKGIVVKAVCVDPNGLYSDVVSNTYFVGKDKQYFKDMKVVSLSAEYDDLFSDDRGIYVVGSYYKQWRNSPEYVRYANLKNPAYPTNYNQSGKEWERPANIQIFENGAPVYSSDIGIRICGNFTRGNDQKSFRLYARSEYGSSKMDHCWIKDNVDINGNVISSYDKITLRNAGNDVDVLHIRDVVNQELGCGRIAACQDSEECILFINGEFWGLYDITEFQDENYIEENFGIDKNDCTIYKTGSGVSAGDRELWNDYCDMIGYISENDMSIDENYNYVCEKVDVDDLMNYIAFQTYICNRDWSESRLSNNYSTWRSNSVSAVNKYSDGKWRCMVYDTDISALHNSNCSYKYDLLNNMRKTDSAMNVSYVFYKLMENESFRNDFREVYTDMVTDTFDADKVLSLVDNKTAYRHDAVIDTFRRYNLTSSIENYDDKLNSYREFWMNRPEYAMQHLETLMGSYEGDRE